MYLWLVSEMSWYLHNPKHKIVWNRMAIHFFRQCQLLLCIAIVVYLGKVNVCCERLKGNYEIQDMKSDGPIHSSGDKMPSRELPKRHRYLHSVIADNTHLTLQKCFDTGEAYSASYLITKEHLLHQFTDYNLTWVNCEMGSFIMMNGRAGSGKKNTNGTVIQSVDVLDFSVIHLSTYERLLGRWARSTKEVKQNRNNLTAVFQAADILKKQTLIQRNYEFGSASEQFSSYFNRTVVIMPYLGVDMGAGHSKLVNRQVYLSACFWSFYAFFPHIVVAVKSLKDVEYIKSSGLPFFHVLLLDNLPKSASLPVATVQTTKKYIQNGTWTLFDYVFFTESDQILMMRNPHELYDYLREFPRHLALPHRLMTYPDVVAKFHHKRVYQHSGYFDWMDMKCCLERQNCDDKRKTWVHFRNDTLALLEIYGLLIPLGNANFHAETYRACKLSRDLDSPCP